jgi:hypothetical protein
VDVDAIGGAQQDDVERKLGHVKEELQGVKEDRLAIKDELCRRTNNKWQTISQFPNPTYVYVARTLPTAQRSKMRTLLSGYT